MLSASVEEYLKAIYKLEEEDQSAGLPTLARQLEVSSVSAIEMVRKLADQGLVLYEPYKGVSLTVEGRAHALTVIRRHRLWERFLTDVLGIPWDQVHEEACRLEHATSFLVEERLEQYLEKPKTCPHGYPIPTPQGKLTAQQGCRLADLEPGQAGIVLRVPEEESELLRYLAGLRLEPQAIVKVEVVAPFQGPVTVRVGNAQHALGHGLASRILVQPLASSELDDGQ